MPVAKKKPTPAAPLPAAPAKPDRPVVHPDVRVVLHLAATGNALTEADADAMLGWEETTDAEAALGVDRDDKKFVTTKNAHNREFVPPHAETLMQTILTRQWEFNAQPGIIDKHDDVQSFQHRLIALKWACQEWRGPNGDHWRKPEYWPDGPPTIDTLVVYGTNASPTVVNTQDTGRPQTYADTLYRGDHFADLVPKKRAKCSKACERAVDKLWDRIGGAADELADRKTHRGMEDFLNRHPGVVKAVRHAVEEDGSGGLSKYLQPGNTAACVYLMAASFSDGDKYHGTAGKDRTEALLDLEHVVGNLPSGQGRTAWQAAEEFFSLLVGTDKSFKGVRDALSNYVPDPTFTYDPANPDAVDGPETYGLGSETLGPTLDERYATVIKAWGAFVSGGPLTKKSLRLAYRRNDDGERVLSDDDKRARFAGIDRGTTGARADEEQDETEADTGFTDAEPPAAVKETVKAAAARIKAEREAKIAGASAGQPLDPLPSSRPRKTPPVPPPASTANGKPVKADPKAAPRRGGTGK